MKFDRYALPFLLSFLMHLVVLAASPGDLFHRREDGRKLQAIRLRLVGGEKVANVEMEESSIPGRGKHRDIGKRLRKNRPATDDSAKRKHEPAGPVMADGKRRVLLDSAAKPFVAPVKGGRAGAVHDEVSVLQRDPHVEPPGEVKASLPDDSDRQGTGPRSRVKESPYTEGKDLRDGSNVGGRAKGGDGAFSPPAIDSVPEPLYPEYSRKHGEEGVVMLKVHIDEMGRGSKIEVLRSSGYRRLDRSAVFALGQARFVPAKRGGIPVPSSKKIAVRFFLKDGD